MAKILIGFLSFAKFITRDDKGVASFGPLNVLAGIGVLGLSFSFVVFSGLQSTQIAQSVVKIQIDPVFQSVQLAQRACTLSPEALTTERVVLEAERAALEALGYSPSGELRLKKSFRNNNRIRINNG